MIEPRQKNKLPYEYVALQSEMNFSIRLGANGNVFWFIEDVDELEYYFERWEYRTAGTAGCVTTGETFEELVLATSNFRLLYHENPRLVLETFSGLNDPDLSRWLRYPENMRMKRHPNSKIGNSTDALTGVFGWQYYGKDSLIEKEKAASRVLIPAGLKSEVALYNDSLRDFQPESKEIIRSLYCRPYDPRDPEDLNAIIAMFKKSKKCDFWSPRNDTWPYEDLAKYYAVEPVKFDGVKATIGNEVIWPSNLAGKKVDSKGKIVTSQAQPAQGGA